MAASNDNVVPISSSLPRTGDNGNGGGIINHRLAELERRLEKLEATAQKINDLCIKMNTKLDSKASEVYVLKIFGVTGGLLVVSLVGHAVLRGLVL